MAPFSSDYPLAKGSRAMSDCSVRPDAGTAAALPTAGPLGPGGKKRGEGCACRFLSSLRALCRAVSLRTLCPLPP